MCYVLLLEYIFLYRNCLSVTCYVFVSYVYYTRILSSFVLILSRPSLLFVLATRVIIMPLGSSQATSVK